jgi:hypothetical protein
MEINPITVVAIIGIISSLKSKNLSGYDEVSSKIIKLGGLQISRSLCYVCNKCICVGIFPDHLKYAIVMPAHKKGDKPSMMNCSPVTPWRTIFKVLETSVYHSLNNNLQLHNI